MVSPVTTCPAQKKATFTSHPHLLSQQLQSGRVSDNSVFNGRKLTNVIHVSAPVSLLTSGNHLEFIQLHIIDSNNAPVELGLSWLKKDNLHIDCVSNKILGWNPYCLSRCLHQAHVPVPLVKDSTDEMTCLLSHLNTWTLGLYLANSNLWSCPYDYGIDLLPGRMPPRGRLYFLSQPETVAMEMYIHESLA